MNSTEISCNMCNRKQHSHLKVLLDSSIARIRNEHCTELYKWTIQRQRMSHWHRQKWSMGPLFSHDVYCSLWYVLGYKCLALLPGQPKAAFHTIHSLPPFFSFSPLVWILHVTHSFLFLIYLQAKCRMVEKFKNSFNCKQAEVRCCNANPRNTRPNIDIHTKLNP